MAEMISADRLLPCLLDRLTDEEPEAVRESSDRRVMTLRRYREAVRRDLESLLNTNCHLDSEDLNRFENVAKSVLNFGIPEMCGMTLSGLSTVDVERKIRQSVLRYEPRVLPDTLTVRVVTAETGPSHPHGNSVTLEIAGELWAIPAPDPLYYRTEVDLETGQIQIKDRSNG
jgi:type VI secretion system protein ImpF